MFSLKNFEPTYKSTWDAIVKNSKNGNFLHTRNYIDYHANRFNEKSVILERKGMPVAVFPCNLQGDEIISHGGLTYGGLIYGRDLRVTEVLEIFSVIFQHYRSLGVRKLRYKAIPHIFHRYPADEDLYALFRLNASLVRRDLSCAIQMDNRVKFSDLRTRQVKKAQKYSVEFLQDVNIADFYTLLESVLIKHGTRPVHSLAELYLLQSRYPRQIRLFTAQINGRILAGTVVYDFGSVVHTQYLASSEEGREVGALDFVLSNLVNTVFTDRKYISFGTSTEQEGRQLNEGLIFQKEGFGGRSVVHDFYEVKL